VARSPVRLSADYGADVIKIEKPSVGDPIREWSPIKDGVSLWWKVTGRNKRLVTLDLGMERGRQRFFRLVERTDAVIENFRPGTFVRWGLGYEELARVNPRIILVHVLGYGQTGPYATRPGVRDRRRRDQWHTESLEQAQAEGKGAASLDGPLIDMALVPMARRLIGKAERIAGTSGA
jgi:hypothetical protein